MRTLQEALLKMENKGGAGQSLRKHLVAAGITEWEHINRSSLYDFRDAVMDSVAPSTAHTLFAVAKAFLNRYSDAVSLPEDWKEILSARNQKPMRTYLNETELKMLEDAPVHTTKQKYVKNVFLICAYTGLRVSDAINLTTENIADGYIRFVAQKTKKAGAIPLKPGLEKRIEWLAEHKDVSVTLVSYNRAVRKMCKDAGIDEEVVVFKAGKEIKGPKWMFVSSHVARISTATCLSKRGASTNDVMNILQHSNPATTNRYIIRDKMELTAPAMGFFS